MDDNDPHCQHWRVCSDCYGRTHGERMESEIAQLRADLAALNRALADERAAVAIAHERIAEVTAERDARPEISRETADEYCRVFLGGDQASVKAIVKKLYEALRAHAAEASEPSPPPTAPPLLEWGPDGPRLSEYERKRLEREAAEASGGEASGSGPFGPVSDWLSKVPSIRRESLGTWRANDCAKCEGSGYANSRASVAGARTCPACNGTGRRVGE